MSDQAPQTPTVEQRLAQVFLEGAECPDDLDTFIERQNFHIENAKQALTALMERVIGEPMPLSDCKQHTMSDYAAAKMRNGSEITVDEQRKRLGELL